MKRTATLIWSFIVLCVGICAGQASNPVTVIPAIKVDQVGYPSSAQKIALYASAQPASTFIVRRADSHEEVFRGKFSSPVDDADSGDRAQAADFSTVASAGSYYLEVPGAGRSWTFAIGPDVFARTYYLAMRGFYGQRCGTSVDMGPEFAAYKHPACHLRGEFHPSSGRKGPRDNIGGWHDAGDYGRYTVNSGISTATLLWAWEMFPAQLKSRKLDIPETGDGTPDILNEARWNIEWMLKMQDEDGGAWHKQTGEKFAGFVSPEKDTLPSEVIGIGSAPYKSTCATGDLAAVAAIAARVYAQFDKAFAERSLTSARSAWNWAERHPDVTFSNPPGVSTGEYGDRRCDDERLWAAAELWRTTGDAAYQHYFLTHYAEFLPTVQSAAQQSWAQLAPMALWTYVLANRNDRDQHATDVIRKASLDAARQIARRTNENGYRVSLLTRDYVWGSNGLAAQYGMQLLIADRLAPDLAFRQAARDNLHYLLGRNTFSFSWVTQVGENPYRHPHHRPSVATGAAEPWPGLLSGGPNAGREDAVLKRLPPQLPPAKVYRDDTDSYASNEIAINWQAALVFLVAGELR